MADRYRNFAELKHSEKEGTDYRICAHSRASLATVIAPHGGYIEHGTAELASAIAGADLSVYSFEALRPKAGNAPGRQHPLHITSHHFDEPICVDLVEKSRIVVAIHGRADRGNRKAIYLGGLNKPLVQAMATALRRGDFLVKTDGHEFPAEEPRNICNRGLGGGGIQFELPHTLRNQMVDDEERDVFVKAVRGVVDEALSRL